jgi:hypothetical protein
MRGLKEQRQRVNNLAHSFPSVVARALYLRGETIMTRSKQEFVPVAEDRGGTLRASGHVKQPERIGRKIRVALVYGGQAAAYAIAVHEHLSEHSPESWVIAESSGRGVHFHPTNHGPKFLERPLMEAVQTLAADLAHDIDLAKAVKDANHG